MKLISFAACTFLLLLPTLNADPLNPQGNAKITRNEAQHIALKQHPGARVTHAKLETVQGKLVWSLQILTETREAQHVAVDAMTGRLVPEENEKR